MLFPRNPYTLLKDNPKTSGLNDCNHDRVCVGTLNTARSLVAIRDVASETLSLQGRGVAVMGLCVMQSMQLINTGLVPCRSS